MDQIVVLAIVVGILLACGLAWGLARRFGLILGLTVPVLAAATMYYRVSTGSDHPEAAMGSGMEQLFLWYPLIGLTAVCCLAGLISRWVVRRRPSQ
jgi:hypothetical protein